MPNEFAASWIGGTSTARRRHRRAMRSFRISPSNAPHRQLGQDEYVEMGTDYAIDAAGQEIEQIASQGGESAFDSIVSAISKYGLEVLKFAPAAASIYQQIVSTGSAQQQVAAQIAKLQGQQAAAAHAAAVAPPAASGGFMGIGAGGLIAGGLGLGVLVMALLKR